MTIPTWLKGPSTLRARIYWSILPFVLVLWLIHGVLDLRAHMQLVEGEFIKRGQTMSSNLAQGIELGVFAEDTQLLEASVRGVVGDPDVAYVVIYAEDGKILTRGGRQAGEVTELGWQFSQQEMARLSPSGEPFSERVANGGKRFIEFVSPVLSEEMKTADDLLIGFTDGTGDQARPRQRTIGVVKLGLSFQSVDDHVVAILKLWIIATVVVLTLCVFAIYGFSRRIVRPVKQLTDQAKMIADGFFDQKIRIESRDEIGMLAATFNRMGASLKRTIGEKERVLAELQDLNRTLEDRIAERTAELKARTLELQHTLNDVRAMGEISHAVSSTLDLQKVLSTIVVRAVELSGSSGGVIYEYDEVGQIFHVRATYRTEEGLLKELEANPVRLGEGAIGQATSSGAPVQVPDILNEQSTVPKRRQSILLRSGYRSLLAIPLLLEKRVMGGLVVFRQEVGNFPTHVVNLLETVARHSVVAIENAQLFREIGEKSDQLRIASEHKSQFLANMSHELRTPLNAILGYTELILDNIYGDVPEKIQQIIERVAHNGRHLLGLINDVLDLSKIEAGQFTLSLNNYSMKEVVNTVVVSVESLGAEKSLALKTTVPPTLPVGKGDESRLTQVLLNLVGNAIKFTDVGEISVEVAVSGEAFVVSVSDTGVGISEAHQGYIFDEFQQINTSSTREKGGAGLGLAIAKRIIEMHGGRLWVESSPGMGSTFSFTLPVRVERQMEAT